MNLGPVEVENVTGLHIGLGVYGNGKKAAFLGMNSQILVTILLSDVSMMARKDILQQLTLLLTNVVSCTLIPK